MPMFKNVYECPCGHTWDDEWNCTCDDRCPRCNTSCSPSFSYDLEDPVQVNEMDYNTETLEEHSARMKKIAEEVKADIKAGRYRHGQIQTHIRGDYAQTMVTETGRWPSKHVPEGLYEKSFTDLYMSGFISEMRDIIRGRSKVDMQMASLESLFKLSKRPVPSIFMDECHYIEPKDMWLRPEPKEKDWDRKKFKSGPPTTPSEATRIKRREERKRKKGSK